MGIAEADPAHYEFALTWPAADAFVDLVHDASDVVARLVRRHQLNIQRQEVPSKNLRLLHAVCE